MPTPEEIEATAARAMKICEECGLPILACNAMAMYRKAAEEMGRGRLDQAKSYAESAREWEEEFRLRRGHIKKAAP